MNGNASVLRPVEDHHQPCTSGAAKITASPELACQRGAAVSAERGTVESQRAGQVRRHGARRVRLASRRRPRWSSSRRSSSTRFDQNFACVMCRTDLSSIRQCDKSSDRSPASECDSDSTFAARGVSGLRRKAQPSQTRPERAVAPGQRSSTPSARRADAGQLQIANPGREHGSQRREGHPRRAVRHGSAVPSVPSRPDRRTAAGSRSAVIPITENDSRSNGPPKLSASHPARSSTRTRCGSAARERRRPSGDREQVFDHLRHPGALARPNRKSLMLHAFGSSRSARSGSMGLVLNVRSRKCRTQSDAAIRRHASSVPVQKLTLPTGSRAKSGSASSDQRLMVRTLIAPPEPAVEQLTRPTTPARGHCRRAVRARNSFPEITSGCSPGAQHRERLPRRGAGEFDLRADEGGAGGLVVLFEVVREDEARRVLVGLRADRGQEGVAVGHEGSLA